MKLENEKLKLDLRSDELFRDEKESVVEYINRLKQHTKRLHDQNTIDLLIIQNHLAKPK